MRSWRSVFSMVVIAIVAGLVWTATATAQKQFTLTASDAEQNDYFGQGVSVSGLYAIVGAPGNDDNGSESGSAYIFTRSDTGWIETAKLIAADAAEGDYFGFSVSISGNYTIVGAERNDDAGNSSGSAYIFERTGDDWSQAAKLTASDAAAGDAFGYSVSIYGDRALVGAWGDSEG